MNSIIERRSVRKFDGRPVPEDVVEKLLRATLTAPSSKNTRSTRLAVSSRAEHALAVSQMRSTGTSFVSAAPLLVFVMGEPAASDMWLINASISATVLQLAAAELGLGSCWVHVDGRPHNEADPEGMSALEWLRSQIPSLPPELPILCVVAVGYPLEPARPRHEVDDSDKIFRL